MQEIWKDICGKYQVSNLGNVRNKNTNRILKAAKGTDGYLFVMLCENGKAKAKRVNRLVAEAFISNNKNKPCVNHVDGNKLNNIVSNLEWCTHSENMAHAYKTGLKKATKNKITRKVNQYDMKGNFIKAWQSIKDIERTLNIDHSSISKACRKKLKVVGGYMWEYI